MGKSSDVGGRAGGAAPTCQFPKLLHIHLDMQSKSRSAQNKETGVPEPQQLVQGHTAK